MYSLRFFFKYQQITVTRFSHNAIGSGMMNFHNSNGPGQWLILWIV